MQEYELHRYSGEQVVYIAYSVLYVAETGFCRHSSVYIQENADPQGATSSVPSMSLDQFAVGPSVVVVVGGGVGGVTARAARRESHKEMRGAVPQDNLRGSWWSDWTDFLGGTRTTRTSCTAGVTEVVLSLILAVPSVACHVSDGEGRGAMGMEMWEPQTPMRLVPPCVPI
jgi:hypothetical protein